MKLPCQVSPDHCWGHHPGSMDCLEFRPRGCTEDEVIGESHAVHPPNVAECGPKVHPMPRMDDGGEPDAA